MNRFEWITPCAWIDHDDGSLHIDVPKMLRELGVPDTAANRDECTQMATEQLQRMLKKTPAVIHVTQ